ncbi:MAG: MFS transporter [Planctomycetaceae bacterium]|jgi:FSR family fosmidomycin resistance protein-like MFS transporter|nr:MFS transporter [Planctomycetaceae bacterium]
MLPSVPAPKIVYPLLWALCVSHLFNDAFQSVIPAVSPLFQKSLQLTYTQIGLIATVFQLASSIFQPVVGWVTDRYPLPYSLPAGMTSTLIGILLLSHAWNFYAVLTAVTFIGFGSAVFHPEASRLVYMTSGGRPGFAQSLFQVGGNAGSSLGPLLAAVVTLYGQKNIIWFGILVFLAVLWMIPLSRWYARRLKQQRAATAAPGNLSVSLAGSPEVLLPHNASGSLPNAPVYRAVFILLLLVFSKNLYTVCFSNFLIFYLIEQYRISILASQLFLFAFLLAVAAGTILGGPAGDRFGRKWVIWFSILGAAPFSLILPYVHSLWATCVLSMVIGAVMASSFPAILIFAQELIPGKVGTVGGLFFGFSFGAGAIASALLGVLADIGGVTFVYNLCSYMPLIGLLTWFLPNLRRQPVKGEN